MPASSIRAYLTAALLLIGACKRAPEPAAVVPADAGVLPRAVAPEPAEVVPDAGHSEFECEVREREECGVGRACLFSLLADGGVGSRCETGACDPSLQDCEEGEKCSFVREDGGTRRACVPAGPVEEGQPCHARDGADTCAMGLFCTATDSADGGVSFRCARFCRSDEACADTEACHRVLRFPGSTELALVCGVSEAPCNLLAPECAEGQGCYPAGGDARCARAGTYTLGAICEFANQCQPGATCAGTEGKARQCRALCSLAPGESVCEVGRCQPLPGDEVAGACVP